MARRIGEFAGVQPGLGFGAAMRRIIAMAEGTPVEEDQLAQAQPLTPSIGGAPTAQEPSEVGTDRAAGTAGGVGFGGTLLPLMNFRQMMYRLGRGGALYGPSRGIYGSMGAWERLSRIAQSMWAPQRVPQTQRGDFSRGFAQRGVRTPPGRTFRGA